MEFCKTYNAGTAAQEGTIIPVLITVYADRSFTFVTKTPPAAVLIKQKARQPKAPRRPAGKRWARSPGPVGGDRPPEDAGFEHHQFGDGDA